MENIITMEMVDNLDYDLCEKSSASAPNNLKRAKGEELLNVRILDHTLEEAIERIQENITKLASLEAEDNCIPCKVAEEKIRKGLKLLAFRDLTISPENLAQVVRKEQRFYTRTRSHHSISLIFQTIFCSLSGEYAELCIAYDAPRKRFIEHLFLDVLKYDKAPQSGCFEYLGAPAQFHPLQFNVQFIFQGCDYNAAIHQLLKTFEDPTNEYRIRTIIVQESCVERFSKMLLHQLQPYPLELTRDEVFVERYNETQEILSKLKASTLQPMHNTKEKIIPIICQEFDERYFPNPSPIVVLKTFRTVKEAIGLAKQNEYVGATIWTTNFSMAYEIIQGLRLGNFWINCLGMDCSMFKTIDLIENVADYDNISKIIPSSGVSMENNFHFEYFLDGNFCKKITFPFGATFAN